MPRWPDDYQRKSLCHCGASTNRDARTCRSCMTHGKPLSGKSGAQHPAWKGGQTVDRDGDIRTYAPNHRWPRRSGYVLEHVRVMELAIGRRIAPNEVVHHKDHDKQNNELGNLELMTRGEHPRHHRDHDVNLRERDSSGRFM